MKTPQISLIVSCSSIERQARTFLESIALTQTTEQIELFLVSWEGYDYRHFVSGNFWKVHTVHFTRSEGLNEALAKAVTLASAEIIVFLEDHTRMEGDLVAVLPEIYAQGNYPGVGWVVKVGVRATLISWIGYLMEYAYWGPGTPEGIRTDLIPGHNCSYRRDELLALGEQLPKYLLPELIFQWKLLQEGKQFYFTTKLAVRHYQYATLGPLWMGNFWYAWSLAANRSTLLRWSTFKRIVYIGAILLKPLVRWKVLLSLPRDPSYYPQYLLLRCAVGITIGFVVAALGESCGYLFGYSHKSVMRLNRYELEFDRGAE